MKGESQPRLAARLEEGGAARRSAGWRPWVARVLVGAVFFINVQCALQFVIWPGAYTAAYQLEGASAEAVVRSIGICFLMWNATYPPVIARPGRYRVLFGVVIAQQVIGLVGESVLLAGLGSDLAVLAASVMRFIAFDAAGLVALSVAFALTHQKASAQRDRNS